MRRSLPLALTTFRLLLGPAALLSAFLGASRFVYLPILVAGTLSDIFDGILARRLGVATPALRRYDSTTDVIYYLFLLATAWVARREVLVAAAWAIAILLFSETLLVAVSFARFRTYPATHSYLAKAYGLCLLGGCVALLVFNAGDWVILSVVVVGLAANAEILAIHLLLDAPPVDIRSVFDVWRK